MRLRAEASHPTREQVEEVLANVGFDAALRGSPVASLSGGWKMKLALGLPLACHPACVFTLTRVPDIP